MSLKVFLCPSLTIFSCPVPDSVNPVSAREDEPIVGIMFTHCSAVPLKRSNCNYAGRKPCRVFGFRGGSRGVDIRQFQPKILENEQTLTRMIVGPSVLGVKLTPQNCASSSSASFNSISVQRFRLHRLNIAKTYPKAVQFV